MSVREEGGIIFLEGRCAAEEAETLLVALQDRPELAIDASGLVRAHLAVIQILLALRPNVRVAPGNPILADMIMGQP